MLTTKNTITKETLHRFYRGNRKDFAGNFGTVEHNGDYDFFQLDEYDTEYVKFLTRQLKPLEKIFRAETDKSELAYPHGFFVKINFEKDRVYFVDHVNSFDDNLIFMRAGVKLRYLNIYNDKK